ncbi:helix-turn-helix domain-containing protein [Saccharothrix sp. Mg75]|uniref:helix-turn-helix domain-containing protein n=1 Tax=Saccharothrix sp. Mg75 TaxID=3445357 RepID=UPI003EE967B8
MDINDNHIGRRLREVRSWRQLSLTAVAGLAGISAPYLSRIERGLRPVTKRSTLEALASALRVAPAELTGAPHAPSEPFDVEAQAGLLSLETALELFELGDDPGVPVRDWPQIAADVEHLTDLTHVHSDYSAQGRLAPKLIAELHAVYVRHPQRRDDVLRALIRCYDAAMWTTKRLGGRGLPLLAARLAARCAEELDAPAWRGFAAWLRGDAAGPLSRSQQYRRAVRTADELVPDLDDPDVLQSYGVLHLSAALASAAQSDRDTAAVHLAEAQDAADRLDTEVGSFAGMWFGRANVGVWRVTLATEFGDGPKVAEIAKDVHPEVIPSPGRQAEFYADLGRSLMTGAATRERGLAMLLHAERLAPQRVRNDVFVREVVSDHLRRAQRDSGGRELRGLAWRMGVAPTG